jgi:acetolactate synthase-1/2/3 large subunit
MVTKNKKQTVSDQIVAALESHGVRYVFGVPGEETEDLLFSLANSSIQFIPTRHEQGAAFMANVWGRITGKAGVCLATLGPGATNLVTGLADAYLDKAPVLALTGQAHSDRHHKESHQYIDVVSTFRPITKWNTAIYSPAVVSESIAKALKIAEMEKPGVTHIDLPEDIAALPAKGELIEVKKVRRGAPDHKAIASALTLLGRAKKPVILAGNGAIRKLASKHLRMLVERMNIPVVSTFMGKGAISDKSPLSLRTAGMKAKDYPVLALEQADLIICIGYDIAEYDPEYWHTNKKAPIIHIDFDSAEVYNCYQPAVEIVADISATLWEMLRILDEESAKPFTTWFSHIKKAIEKDIASYEKPVKKPTIPFVLHELRRAMKDTDIIISDVGSHKMWIGRNFPVYEPGTCIISNGLASMGIALPGGMAAKLARPELRVVSVMGDGGFMMNSQEIETAKRIGVPYTIVVVNDNDYGLITWKQTSHRGSAVGTTLSNPDFVKYAESFGIKGYKPKTSADVYKTLKKAIDSNQLSLVVIDIDASENMKLSAKLGKNLKIK